MSTYNFSIGQKVKVMDNHLHIHASDEVIYHIGAINRVAGVFLVNLLLNGNSVGVVPEGKLKSN